MDREGLVRSIIENRSVARAAGIIGVLVHLVGIFVYVVLPGLEVSYPTLFVFEAAWVIVLVLSIRWLRDHPWRSAIVPLLGMVLAGVARVLGEQYLGWRG
jgi:hypothetical protein